jgi:hypothetical protein
MSATVIVAKVSLHEDTRSWAIEPIGEPEIPAQCNTHVALTKPGVIREVMIED